MKLFRLYIIASILLTGTLRAQVTLHTEGFETDGEGTRYTSNTYVDCPNSDYFFRTNTNPVTPPSCATFFGTTLSNLQGSFFWASEDIRSNTPMPLSRPPGSITTQNISISGYNTLTVSLFLATSNNNNIRWETADSINIKASIDGGAFRTVGRFMGDNAFGGRLRIDSNLDGIIDGSDVATLCDVANFTQYSFPISGAGNTLQIQLDFDQVGGTEELAIDQITVTGISAPCLNPTVPTASAAPSTICTGGTSTLSITSGTLNNATAWHWYTGSCGGTAVGTGTSIVVSPTVTTTYFVRGEGGCVLPGTCGSVTITVNNIPATPGSISGASPVCSGTTNTYSVTAVAGATSYNWTMPAGWTGSSSTNSIAATASATSGNISVTATNSCGTSAASSRAITVNTIPATPGSVAGNVNICSGSTNTYSVTAVSGATSYNWSIPGGWTGSSSTNSISTVSGITSGNVSVTATNSCGTSSASSVAITVGTTPTAPGSVSGNTSICAGTTNTYSVTAVAGATSYIWILPGGWTGSSSTNSISATSNSTSGSVSVLASNSCGTSSPSLVTANIIAAPVITGHPTNAFVCAGGTTTFTVSATGNGLTYQWHDNGTPVSNGPAYSGVTTPTLTLTNVSTLLDLHNYSCVVTNSCGSSVTSNNGTLSVGATTPPSVTITGSVTICSGNTAGYTAFPMNAGITPTYQWFVNGLPVGTNSLNFSTTSLTNGSTVYCMLTSGNACASPASANSNTITVTVNSIPSTPGTISGNASICAGSVNTYSIAAVAGATTYNWTLPSGWTGASTTNSISATANATSGNVSVTATNSCGTSPASSLAVTVGTSPVVTLQPANVSLCPPNTAYFSVAASGSGLTYQWQVNMGSGFTNLVNDGTYNDVTTADMYILGTNVTMNGYLFQCVITGTCGSPVTTNAATLTVNQPLLVTGSPSPVTLCSGGAATFSAAGTGFSAVIWQESTDGGFSWTNLSNIAPYSGTTTFTLTVAPVTVSMNGYLYRCHLSGVCSPLGQNSGTALLTVNPNPTVVISGPNSVCAGNPVTLTASGASTYQWTSGPATAAYTVTPATTTTYTVTGTDANGCTASQTKTVTVNPLPAPIMMVNTNFMTCQPIGSQIALSAFPASGTLWYTWSFNDPSGTMGLSNNANNTLTINNTTVSGTITVSAVDFNGCSTGPYTQSLYATPFMPPAPTSFSTFTDSVCAGTSNVFYSTPVIAGASGYVWTYSGTGATINGSGASVSIDFASNSTSGSLCVRAVNGSCTTSVFCEYIEVIASPEIAITGDTSLCPGESTVLTASGAATYAWSSGGTNASEMLSPVSTSTFSVSGVNNFGCSASANATVTVHSLPAVTITAPGGFNICAGSSATLIASGAVTYTWSSGGTNPTEIVSPLTSMQYIADGTDTNGCSNSDTVFVNVLPVYAVSDSLEICAGDSILIAGNYQSAAGIYIDTLSSISGCDSVITTTLSLRTVNTSVTIGSGTLTADQSGATYQWVYCDSSFAAIPGETSQTLVPSGNGNFAVIVTENGCSDTSGCYFITSVQSSGVNSIFTIYPNPADESVQIQTTSAEWMTVEVYDIAGRMVLSGTGFGLVILNTGALSSGTYTTKISTAEKVHTSRLSISH